MRGEHSPPVRDLQAFLVSYSSNIPRGYITPENPKKMQCRLLLKDIMWSIKHENDKKFVSQ